ncbi:FKBP12-associated protein [Phlyctochytrium planicorne]|nr:FKBP12-associated protein [Phlyctochytrium planicorne]
MTVVCRCGHRKIAKTCEQVSAAVEMAKKIEMTEAEALEQFFSEESPEQLGTEKAGEDRDSQEKVAPAKPAPPKPTAPVTSDGFLHCTAECTEILPEECYVQYEPELLEFAAANPELLKLVEATFESIVKTKKKWHLFPPMKAPLRKFIHSVAEHYLIETESVDPEPRRGVAVVKVGSKAAVPDVTISKALRLKAMGRLRFGDPPVGEAERLEMERKRVEKKEKKGFAKGIPVPGIVDDLYHKYLVLIPCSFPSVHGTAPEWAGPTELWMYPQQPPEAHRARAKLDLDWNIVSPRMKKEAKAYMRRCYRRFTAMNAQLQNRDYRLSMKNKFMLLPEVFDDEDALSPTLSTSLMSLPAAVDLSFFTAAGISKGETILQEISILNAAGLPGQAIEKKDER